MEKLGVKRNEHKSSRTLKKMALRKENVNLKRIPAPTKKILCARIDDMSFSDMIEASWLSKVYLEGSMDDTLKPSSGKVNEFLVEIERQSKNNRNLVQQSLEYLNRSIIVKNEVENKPSDKIKQIYRRMLQSDE